MEECSLVGVVFKHREQFVVVEISYRPNKRPLADILIGIRHLLAHCRPAPHHARAVIEEDGCVSLYPNVQASANK